MKSTLFKIYDTLALHRLVTLTALVISGLISGLSLWFHFKTQQELRHKSYVIDPAGGVLPIRWSSTSEQLEVEVRAHIQTFIELFYGLEPASMQKNLSKALWLADRSVDELYQQKKSDGVYNRILQYALIHQVKSVSIELSEEQRNPTFITEVIFQVARGTSVDHYRLVATGELRNVERDFPNNPHGLLITNYYEQSLKKIPNEIVQE
ncbi:conjugal transfer protein TraK [Robertkochia marina]|uniref:Conjugal transfer protein TraK n=1 Tax=Robertkochia marina TaxID=1227945 RepID=A0A4V3UY38_9FLAO|nr:VirB8/TrbF family protein [Robertkochia marina]THD67626.1 conjugal transfer protein TraK [Robertkochia marina]TRZ43359.1 conjugal transfer protein TraK [Robertkochia marina]